MISINPSHWLIIMLVKMISKLLLISTLQMWKRDQKG